MNTHKKPAENEGVSGSAAISEAFALPGEAKERVEIALELCKIVEEREIALRDLLVMMIDQLGKDLPPHVVADLPRTIVGILDRHEAKT